MDTVWILEGELNENEAGEYGNQSSPSSNSTSAMGENMSKNGQFVAQFDMVRTNGSALHSAPNRQLQIGWDVYAR